MARLLNTPITDEGLTSVQFFNGRVLSAADLETEQAADRRRRAQLGQALGTGIAHGLRVRPAPGGAPTALRVTKGLAVNRAGESVELFVDVEVSVVDADVEPERATDGGFMACEAVPSVTATGMGAYLLVACPATERRERVPRVAMGDGGMAGSCGPRYRVEGIRFRLVHLDVHDDRLVPAVLRQPLRTLMGETNPSPAEQSRRRNLLAHWCLGTADTQQAPADLYDRLVRAEPPRYGPLDALRTPAQPKAAPALTAHDVPLALFVWEEDHRVTTVDAWAVRRRIHRLGSAPLAGDRRRAEGEAARLQFQQHMAALTRPGSPQALLAQVEATDYFRFLPPVGAVPERVEIAPGFTHLKFFEGLTFRNPVFIEGANVRRLFQLSLAYPPIDLEEKELIWLYRVRQNRQQRPGMSATQAYLLFASGHIPYQGDAQYDLARWSFSNYGPGVAGSITTGG